MKNYQRKWWDIGGERGNLLLGMLWYLKHIKVNDIEIDLWIAILTNDFDMQAKLLPMVPNPHITDVELIQKYQGLFKNNEEYKYFDIGDVFAKWVCLVTAFTFNA